MRRAAASAAMLALLLAGCSDNNQAPEAGPKETKVPDHLAGNEGLPKGAAVDGSDGATPMDERVATIGLLNKRNNLSQDLTMRPGDSQRVGDIIIRLSACERTPAWERPSETGAFVQVMVQGRGDDAENWRKIFSGWLFKNSPSLNVVEHPIYDVWVKECTMRFPGEASSSEGGKDGASDAGGSEGSASASSASPAPAPAAPSTPAEPTEPAAE